MFKRLYKLGNLELTSKCRPEQISKHQLIDLFWECTLTCNAKCKHCGSSAEKKKYDGELSTIEIKNAFRQIANDFDASKILINVTGGEPLVRQDLCEVMEYASDLGFYWGMTTNGILLNPTNIEKLKKAHLNTISISIDGLEKTHDSFRGVPGSYKTILNNIKNLKAANFVEHIQVTTVFHKNNINELNELYTVMENLGLDSWRLVSMDPIGRANENDDLLLDGTDLRNLLDFIKSKKKNSKLQLSYGCPGFLGLDYETEVRQNYFNCRTGINVASILYNGDLFVCPNVPRLKRLIQGNIRTDNFKSVWENKYKDFRTLDRTKCSECEKCDQWNYCLGGSYHTWDFTNNKQNKCTYKMLY